MNDAEFREQTRFFDQVSQACPVPKGARVRLLSMPDDPDPLPPGSEGTVTGGNGSQIWVKWDSGRSLILLPGVDRYTVLSEPSGEPR